MTPAKNFRPLPTGMHRHENTPSTRGCGSGVMTVLLREHGGFSDGFKYATQRPDFKTWRRRDASAPPRVS
jgi:hypothetical protein